MTNKVFEEKLKKLIADIALLPETERSRMMEMVEETRRRHQEVQESGRRSRDLLDDWRLAATYAVFDREARARESKERGSEPEQG